MLVAKEEEFAPNLEFVCWALKQHSIGDQRKLERAFVGDRSALRNLHESEEV
jgi:hypothetical protein